MGADQRANATPTSVATRSSGLEHLVTHVEAVGNCTTGTASTRKGRATFDRVMRGYELLRRYDVDVNILCAVNRANADRPVDVYRFVRDEFGARYLQLLHAHRPSDAGDG